MIKHMIARATFLCAMAIPSGAPAQGISPIVSEVMVDAPIQQVWNSWTTEEGVKTFLAPSALVETRIGGRYEIYFLPKRPLGLRGSEGATILALDPPRRFLFSWNAPEEFGTLRPQLTVVEVELQQIGPAKTRVTLTQTGWGKGAEWIEVRNYFSRAWPYVLSRLAARWKSEAH